ncbi:MAG: penicillin-binding protein 2, partial [Synergistaceae bacterium]
YRAITIATNLTFTQIAELVMDNDFRTVLFLSPMWRRTYPAAQFTAHIVGYVAEITKEELESKKSELYRGGDPIGKNGIEAWYEEELFGTPGEEVIEVNSRGRKLRNIRYTESKRGHDLTLTVDLTAQRYAAELMGNFRGAIVAMDINDGSIKCLYSSPSYDPNPLTWGISNKEWAVLTDHKERPMMNRAISGGYPPASTFKVITAASALENKAVSTSTTVRCPGYFELGNRVFRCWKRSGHGTENVTSALKDSCDVYFYQASQWLGIDNLTATAAKFGVGEKTGLDISGEINGTIAGASWKKRRLKESWYGGDTVNYSIGQGFVLMTPVQLVRVYAAVANGGKLLKPRINAASPVEYEPLGVDPAIITVLRRGLLDVTKSGTGRRANTFGVSLAGKTGTAQNSQGDDHAWFAGYAPADKPRYAVVAIAEAGKAGSAVTGPIVGKMLNYLINGKRYEADAVDSD